MAAQSEKVVFNNWSGGDYGRAWAGEYSDDEDPKDPPSKFRAINVIPYPGGWLGPRQPLVKFTLPAVGGQRALPAKALWFVENEILFMSDGSAWNVVTGQCNTNVGGQADKTRPDLYRDFSVSQKQNGEMFMVSSDVATEPSTVIGFGAASLADTTPTFFDRPVGGPTPMPNGLRLGNHEDSDILASWRTFYWANLNQAVVWQPTDFNVVGRCVYDLIDQKNTLVMLIGGRASNSVSSGLDSATRFGHVPGVGVFVVTGTLGAGAQFRIVDTGPAPEATDTGSFIWAVAGDDVWWFNNRWFVTFDGAKVFVQDAPVPRLLHNTTNYSYGPNAVVNFWCQNPARAQGEFIVSGSVGKNGGDESAVPDATTRRGVFCWNHGFSRGGAVLNSFVSRNTPVIWTCHDPGIEFRAEVAVDDAGPRDGSALSRKGDGNFYVWRRGENKMVFTTQGSTAHTEAPKFYEMDLNAGFPAYTGHDGDTTDVVVADLYTQDYWDPQAREIAVQSITIDYAYAPNADQATNQTATFEIESVQLDNDNRLRKGGPVTFTPPGSGVPSESGSKIVRGRATIPCRSDGSGSGFRVHVSGWRGMTIRTITATITVTSERP